MSTEFEIETEELTEAEVTAAWAEAARALLIATAGSYHQVATRAQVAAHVQRATGHLATRQPHTWVGGVLALVSEQCAQAEEPDLTALCVDAQGAVGTAYAATVTAREGTVPDDVDRHAARERLACHRHFGAALPAGGGVASLTPQLSESRSRKRRADLAARPVATCPRCYMVLPAHGGCDSCE